jgi:hypothetical protein
MEAGDTAGLAGGDEAVWGPEVVVVEDPDVGQVAEGGAEICEDARIAGEKLCCGNVVPALRNSHGDALVRYFGAGKADEAEEEGVAISACFVEKR